MGAFPRRKSLTDGEKVKAMRDLRFRTGWDEFVAAGDNFGWDRHQVRETETRDVILGLAERQSARFKVAFEAGWEEFLAICDELRWDSRVISEGSGRAAVIVAMQEAWD